MREFSEVLTKWYELNKRSLPWRETIDPYKIWLSEVILQQTRVNQGLSYYLKFVEAYPTVADLAAASEQEVLKLWQGLGYYSRARNLRHTAQLVVELYGKDFPTSHADLLKLKGIGPYTAAAVSSFSSDERVAVVDGNVYRVLSRIFGIDLPIDSTQGKKTFAKLANDLLPTSAAQHNQAIMEFGATVCKPKQAQCTDCIFRASCHAHTQDLVYALPVKQKKTKVTTRHFNYLVFNHDENIYLKERSKGDVWQGLYDFPLLESDGPLEDADWLVAHADFEKWIGLKPVLTEKSVTYRHLLSHREILATFWEFELEEPFNQSSHKVADRSKPIEYPLPQLIVNYLEKSKTARRKKGGR